MPESDPDHKKLLALIAAYLDGDIDPPERQELAELISGGAEARKLYLDLVCLDVLLRRHHAASMPPDDAFLILMAEEANSRRLQDSDSDAMMTDVLQKRDSRQFIRRPWLAAAAAIVVLVIGGIIIRMRWRTGPVSEPVAVLSSAEHADWEDGSISSGAALKPGEHLRIRSGLLHVNFNSSAAVTLEGPCDFQFTGANVGNLVRGRLLAQVPPSAKGFTVRCSGLVVTDQGTEFAMSVTESGLADVAVLRGRVDMALSADPTQSTQLTQGLAGHCSVNGGGTIEIRAADVGGFSRLIPPPLPAPGRDIGSVPTTGASAFDSNDGSYSITSRSDDIWGSKDAFHFVDKPMAGDLTITARILTQSDTDKWAKAGLMIRSSEKADASFAEMVMTPGHGASFQFRIFDGQNINYATDPFTAPAKLPAWLKLTRRRNRFSGYVSSDGLSWSQAGKSVDIAMPDSARVGLAVTSKNVAVPSTARFDNVLVGP